MQSTSLPTMVVVLLAVFPALCALGAQVIAGRYQQRRADDDRKWDKQAHWREKRFEVYSEFVEVALECQRAFNPMFGTMIPNEDLRVGDVRGMLPDLGSVQLIASPQVGELAEHVVESLRAYCICNARGVRSTTEQVDAVATLLDEQLDALRTAFRAELSLDADQAIPEFTDVGKVLDETAPTREQMQGRGFNSSG